MFFNCIRPKVDVKRKRCKGEKLGLRWKGGGKEGRKQVRDMNEKLDLGKRGRKKIKGSKERHNN